MKPNFEMRRWVSGLVLASFAVAALSPAAEARPGRRYKGVPEYGPPPAVSHSGYAPRRVVYVERHSDAAPLFAGLIGGLVIGSILAQSNAPAYPSGPAYSPGPACAPAPAYYYYDPWCHERFTSLGFYQSHFYHHHHPRVVRVVSVETGACVDTYGWHDGNWYRERGGDEDD